MSTHSAFRWSTWIGIIIDDRDLLSGPGTSSSAYLRPTPGQTLHAESSDND
jgi:hypothetical protein